MQAALSRHCNVKGNHVRQALLSYIDDLIAAINDSRKIIINFENLDDDLLPFLVVFRNQKSQTRFRAHSMCYTCSVDNR